MKEEVRKLLDAFSLPQEPYSSLTNPRPEITTYLMEVAQFLYTTQLTERNLNASKKDFLNIVLANTLNNSTLQKSWEKLVLPLIPKESPKGLVETTKQLIVSLWTKVWVCDFLEKNFYTPEKTETLKEKIRCMFRNFIELMFLDYF